MKSIWNGMILQDPKTFHITLAMFIEKKAGVGMKIGTEFQIK